MFKIILIKSWRQRLIWSLELGKCGATALLSMQFLTEWLFDPELQGIFLAERCPSSLYLMWQEAMADGSLVNGKSDFSNDM